MSARRPLALVTGGVRRLGAEIAGTLAEAGYDLALSSHDRDAAIPETVRAAGGAARLFHADLSEPDASAHLIDRVVEDHGRAPDLLVNNAAIFGQDGWREMTAETIDAHHRLNFRAPVLLTQALAKALGGEGRGAAIHICDQRVANPVPQQISYTFSKQALAASIRTLAVALAPTLRVNGVAPGLTLTNPEHSKSAVAATRDAMPLDCLPDPADIAGAVLYLAQAKSVTGQLLFVDCGAHLKSFDTDFAQLG